MIGPRGEGSKKIVPPSKEDMRMVIEAGRRRLATHAPFCGIDWGKGG